MNVSTEWMIGILFLLIFGGYGWTTMVGGWLNGKIEDLRTHTDERLDELRDNHIAHLEARIRALEEGDQK